jgi:hypothetical protein
VGLTVFTQLIVSLLKPMEEHTQEAKVEEEAARLPVSLFAPHVEQLTTVPVQIKIAIYAVSSQIFVFA